MSECSIDGCNKEEWCRGICQMHYQRMRRAGQLPAGTRARGGVRERVHRHYKRGAPTQCWLWEGFTTVYGYGQLAAGPKGGGTVLAHRAAWESHHGRDIPKGMVIMHSCDTPACVNPAHLILGTQRENMKDMHAKKRHVVPHARGTEHHSCRFTEIDVRHIRRSSLPPKDLAAQYGVNVTSINRIRSRKTWKHVE